MKKTIRWGAEFFEIKIKREIIQPGAGYEALAKLIFFYACKTAKYYAYLYKIPEIYADDMASEFFIIAARGLVKFEGKSKFSTYLTTAWRNKCKDIVSRKKLQENYGCSGIIQGCDDVEATLREHDFIIDNIKYKKVRED